MLVGRCNRLSPTAPTPPFLPPDVPTSRRPDLKDRLNEYSQRGTVFFVNSQVLLILNATHRDVGGTEIPNPYNDFLNGLSFLTLDVVSFVPFDCMYKGFNHVGTPKHRALPLDRNRTRPC